MELVLRPAEPGDVDLLFHWANDPVTRQNAFHTQQIPYERHVKWFDDSLRDAQTVIYICMDGEEPVGQLRFNINGEEALISYSVDVERRGQGIGKQLLRIAEARIGGERPDVTILRGEVKYGNIASMKAFERNGYCKREKDEWIEYVKRLP